MSPIIEGGLKYENAGAPVNGTNEVQTLTIGGTPTGGTFKLAFDGLTTEAITWTDVDATLVTAIQTALRALANIGAAGVTVADTTLTSGIGDVTITFGGNLAKLVVPTISVALNSLAGTLPTLAVAETTPGVNATARGAAVGALLIDTTNAKLYKNDGTALEPAWNSVGDIASTEIADDAVTNAKLANITRGYVKVGGAADAPTDLNAKTSGQILVGDGTDLKSVAVSGDVGLAANGAATVVSASVTVPGKVELATTAETITGTDAVRAVTPAGLAGAGLTPNVPIASAVMAVGAETGGNTINVTIQLKDALAADLAVRGRVQAYLSDDANGDSIAAAAPSGGVAIGTDGLAIPVVAGKALLLTSEVDGDIDLTIIEAGAATWYLIIVLPNGLLNASGAITFAP